MSHNLINNHITICIKIILKNNNKKQQNKKELLYDVNSFCLPPHAESLRGRCFAVLYTETMRSSHSHWAHELASSTRLACCVASYAPDRYECSRRRRWGIEIQSVSQ